MDETRVCATEFSCAAKFGYLFVGHLIINDELGDKMRKKVLNLTGSDASEIRSYEYRTGNDLKLHSFAMEQNKLYLEQDKTNEWGLFSMEDLKCGDYIGRYGGIVDEKLPVWSGTAAHPRYCIQIPECGYYINSSEMGSAMRLVKQAKNPSCLVKTVVDDGLFNILIIAARNIKPGDEITVNTSTLYQDPGCGMTSLIPDTDSRIKFNDAFKFQLRMLTCSLKIYLPNNTLGYYEAYNIMHNELTELYFAKPKKNSKFLHYDHYLYRIDMEQTHSKRRRWCSLCDLPYTFRTKQDMYKHFCACHCLKPDQPKLNSNLSNYVLFCNNFRFRI